MSTVEKDVTVGVSVDALPTETIAAPVDPVLARAAQLLRRGWHKRGWHYQYRKVDGGKIEHVDHYCLVAAINHARGLKKLNQTTGRPLMSHLERMGFSSGQEAWRWNDEPDRTADQVIERVERAAYGL